MTLRGITWTAATLACIGLWAAAAFAVGRVLA